MGLYLNLFQKMSERKGYKLRYWVTVRCSMVYLKAIRRDSSKADTKTRVSRADISIKASKDIMGSRNSRDPHRQMICRSDNYLK